MFKHNKFYTCSDCYRCYPCNHELLYIQDIFYWKCHLALFKKRAFPDDEGKNYERIGECQQLNANKNM